MIYFEENIFYPITHKQDYINLEHFKLPDGLDNPVRRNACIHYKVSSDRQNNRWFIAVSLEENGQCIIQQQLSKQFDNYGLVSQYISKLPKLIEGQENKLTLDNEMKADFETLIGQVNRLLVDLMKFEEKYNI